MWSLRIQIELTTPSVPLPQRHPVLVRCLLSTDTHADQCYALAQSVEHLLDGMSISNAHSWHAWLANAALNQALYGTFQCSFGVQRLDR